MFGNYKSRVVKERVDNEEILQCFRQKFKSLNLGRRVECGIHLPWLNKPVRSIKKNGKQYHVCEADFLGVEQDVYAITKCFLAERKGTFSALMFVVKADRVGALFANDRTEVVLDDEKILLKDNPNIFDVNEMRFEMRNYPKISDFMDSFILTNVRMREDYKKYEISKLNNTCTVSKKLSAGR